MLACKPKYQRSNKYECYLFTTCCQHPLMKKMNRFKTKPILSWKKARYDVIQKGKRVNNKGKATESFLTFKLICLCFKKEKKVT